MQSEPEDPTTARRPSRSTNSALSAVVAAKWPWPMGVISMISPWMSST
jgi:hypothetical protein